MKIRSCFRALPLAALLLTTAPAAAQESAPAPAADSPAAAAQTTGLPAGVPRSMRAYTHVFVAFGVAWVLLFGYTVSVARRFRRLEEQLEAFTAAE